MQSTKVFFRRFSLHLYSGADNQSFIHVEKHVENFFLYMLHLAKKKRVVQLALSYGPIRFDELWNMPRRLLKFVLMHKEVC